MSPAPYEIPPFPYADLLTKGAPFGDWRDDLARDGFVVVPGVISPEKAKDYRCVLPVFTALIAPPLTATSAGRAPSTGCPRSGAASSTASPRRTDRTSCPSTTAVECTLRTESTTSNGCVASAPGGWRQSAEPLTLLSPSQVWDIRLEPSVRAAFAKLWGTDKLVSSFDTAAIMLPGPPKPPSADDVRFAIGCAFREAALTLPRIGSRGRTLISTRPARAFSSPRDSST